MRWDGGGDDGADDGDGVDDDHDDARRDGDDDGSDSPLREGNSPADFSLPELFFLSVWFPPSGGGGKIIRRCPRRF